MSSTMGPGIDIDPTRLRVTEEELARRGRTPAEQRGPMPAEPARSAVGVTLLVRCSTDITP